ncbi:MAG: hypothetical protein Q4G16_03015 [Cruoricaptor ignavus]|nr:hypothetical protein [Cruoricaptor ignavus]
MKSKFYILMMFVALGIFLIPKQILFAQTNDMDCCNKTETSTKCHSETENKEKDDCSDSQNPCTSKCCVDCATCSIFSILLMKPENANPFLGYQDISKKVLFSYSTPYLSYGLRDIWQPPKIS